MDLENAVLKVIRSGQFILGEEVESFERELAAWAGVKYVIGVNSGTDALLLALRAIGKQGDIITTPFTFISTAETIVNAGYNPVFADIGEDLLIDPYQIRQQIFRRESGTGIIPVHLFNKKCDMEEIMKIARRYNMFVIEDSCQHFSKGIDGDLKCFSFYPTKMLGGMGDGGAVLTNNKELADKIRMLRNHGSDPNDKYLNRYIGVNSRLDEIQAAVLRIKLKQGNFINKQTFESGKYYPRPLHLQPCFRYLKYKKGDFPITEKASNKINSPKSSVLLKN